MMCRISSRYWYIRTSKQDTVITSPKGVINHNLGFGIVLFSWPAICEQNDMYIYCPSAFL